MNGIDSEWIRLLEATPTMVLTEVGRLELAALVVISRAWWA